MNRNSVKERYERKFSLAQNLYADGSPLLIVGGALLLDTETSKLLVQLKFCNLEKKHVKYTKVRITLLDPMERELGEPIIHEYLDIEIKRGESFGHKTPIYIEKDTARSFRAELIEVGFDDNTVWHSDRTELFPLPAQKRIKDTLPDRHAQVAYRAKFGPDATHQAVSFEKLWLCTCRTANLKCEAECIFCGAKLNELTELDTGALFEQGVLLEANKLSAEKDTEKLNEAKELLSKIPDSDRATELRDNIDSKLKVISERKNKQKRVLKRTMKIAIPSLLAAAVLSVLLFLLIIPLFNYTAAMGLSKDGDYFAAYEKFSKYGEFLDTEEQLEYIKEQELSRAKALAAEGDYAEAYGILIRYDAFKGDYASFCTLWGYVVNGDYKSAVLAGITDIKIPSSVTEIKNDAFKSCVGLKSVTLHSGITKIGNNAFYGCSGLTELIIPEGVTYIGQEAFSRCTALSSVSLPSTLVSIGAGAFRGCTSLSSVNLPEQITSIPKNCFLGADALKKITLPSDTVQIETSAFEDCSELTEINLNNGLKAIGEAAFRNCASLAELSVPDTVTVIGAYAFEACSKLNGISISGNLTKIGDYAFKSCTSLKSASISKAERIGKALFFGCGSLSELSVPYVGSAANSTENEGLYYLFSTSTGGGVVPASLKSVTLGAITNLDTGTFLDCDTLETIKLPQGLVTIGNSAFSGCSALKEIQLPSSVSTINDKAFYGCTSLTSLEIPFGVKAVKTGCFSGCTALESVTIPNGVTQIASEAFLNCKSLKKVTIPPTLNTFGTDAFRYCSSLTEVHISDVAAWCAVNFNNVHSSPLAAACHLYLGEKEITELVIPDSVTAISNFAFYHCNSFYKVTLGANVSSIGSLSFRYCNRIVELYNLSPLTITLGSAAYGYLSQYPLHLYTDAEAPSKVRTDSNGYAFYENGTTCYLLGYYGSEKDLTLPDSCNGKLYQIYKFCFYNCQSITSVTLSANTNGIGNQAFYHCKGLTEITIPASVSSIGEFAFRDCENLSEVTYLGTPTVASNAYDGTKVQ